MRGRSISWSRPPGTQKRSPSQFPQQNRSTSPWTPHLSTAQTPTPPAITWYSRRWLPSPNTHAATRAQGDVSPPVNPRASRSLAEQVQRRRRHGLFFPSSGTFPLGFFLYRSKETMAYRFYVSPLMAHTASGRVGYVTGVHRPRSRLYAYRFYMLSLLAHTALGRAGYVFIVPDHGFTPTGSICHPWWHTRLQAEQVKWRWCSSPITVSSQASYMTGGHHLITALCLQVLCVALDDTRGFTPYRKYDGCSSSPVMALCL
jgi:hypothetical protein